MPSMFGKARLTTSLSLGVYGDALLHLQTPSRLKPNYFVEYNAEHDRFRKEMEALIESWTNETIRCFVCY